MITIGFNKASLMEENERIEFGRVELHFQTIEILFIDKMRIQPLNVYNGLHQTTNLATKYNHVHAKIHINVHIYSYIYIYMSVLNVVFG